MPTAQAGAFTLFGITGDLARKLVLPALYRLEERGLLDTPVLGVARHDWDNDALHAHLRASVEAAIDAVDRAALGRLVERTSYLRGEYDDAQTYEAIRARLGERAETGVYYLAVPPSLFTVVADQLARAHLNERSRLVVEKPFGHDLESAKALNAELQRHFSAEQILRVDHFLGKDALGDLLVLRFANRLLEPILNRESVETIQITFAETLDVSERGGFYDAVGALRDVVENHLFQVLAHVTMEPPESTSPGDVEAQRTALFSAVRTLRHEDVVRGQYRGFREIEGVASDSTTETYLACRLAIDNDRWRGVPIAIRTGKCLPTDLLEAVIGLKAASCAGLGEQATAIRFRLQPGVGIAMDLLAKRPGPDLHAARLRLAADLERQLGSVWLAYEPVIADALAGNPGHFPSEASIEECWRIVADVLDPKDEPIVYEPGTWGPKQADDLVGSWLALRAHEGAASGAE